MSVEVEVLLKGFLTRKGKRLGVVTSIKTFNGSEPVVDIRQNVADRETQEWVPTGSGCSIPLAELDTYIANLRKLRDKAEKEGLL
jgi:hypothetical protein